MLAVINIDPLMRRRLCGKLHGGRSQLLFSLQQSSIDSQLFAENRDLCLLHLHSTAPLGGPHRNIARNVWCGKSRMVWLPNYGKQFKDMFTRFDRIHERERQTDKRTDRHHITA